MKSLRRESLWRFHLAKEKLREQFSLKLSPIEFMRRLAALVPRLRVNLTRYHGVFSLRSKSREHVVPRKPADESGQLLESTDNKAYSMPWVQRLMHAFSIDPNAAPIEKCEKCGGKAKITACIGDADVIEKILKHLGLDEASQASNRSPPARLFGQPIQLF